MRTTPNGPSTSPATNLALVPLLDNEPHLLQRLAQIRAEGNVPLVGDARWSASYWKSVATAAVEAELPTETGWAALTSGSSGTPRVVLRTDASWGDSYPALSELMQAGPQDLVALPAPASSSLTLFSLAHALAGGPQPLLLSGTHASALAESAATHFHGTPQTFAAAMRAGLPKTMHMALIGGSHLDPALREAAEQAGIRVVSYYGAAELSLVALDHGDGLQPFDQVEYRVREGELWVRTPYLISGYAQLSGEGAAGADAGLGAQTGPLRCDGGWATVGDRAELIEEPGLSGTRLRLLGRADEAILSASATIVPEEVEATLRGIPGVRDAMVFGLPRESIGALVAAYLECEETVTAAQLRTEAEPLLAPAHIPRVWFRGVLPRTASGKPARRKVLRAVQAGEVERIG